MTIAPGKLDMSSGSLVESLHQRVRHSILNSGYAPGEPISEVGLAAQYQVARPTARSAVDRLIAEGLLMRSGRKAAYVRSLSPDEVRELYTSRILLESFVHRGLAERRIAPPSAIAANSALRAHAAGGDAASMIEADIDLHQNLVRAYGNSRIERMHNMLMGEAHLCMARVQANQLLRADIIADEHSAILQAITRGDADDAERLTEYHLRHAEEKLLASMGGA